MILKLVNELGITRTVNIVKVSLVLIQFQINLTRAADDHVDLVSIRIAMNDFAGGTTMPGRIRIQIMIYVLAVHTPTGNKKIKQRVGALKSVHR